MSLRALVVDFNSYFASVEQVLRPELRGRPVAVVPVLTDSTCCIAASQEAKVFGIRTGTRVGDARAMCPDLECVESRPEEYVRLHRLLVEAVETCTHVEEVWSIDEMYCRLTGRQIERREAVALAKRIKGAVANVARFARSPAVDDAGAAQVLTCSIGVAPNGLLAKVGSDMQKPDGLVVIETEDLPRKLYSLELADFCGIGPRMERRLHECGIYTVPQLCTATEATLRMAWNGVNGSRMFRLLRGEEVERPATEKHVLGHSHVLPPELRSEPGARSVCDRLVQKAALRLRKSEYCAAGLELTIKYQDRRWNDHITFTETQDTFFFLQMLHKLWQRRQFSGLAPRAVGVSLYHLTPIVAATPSFPQFQRDHSKLLAAMDAVNLGMGKNKVYLGGAHGALAYTPMRIAFNRIPDPTTEG